MFTIHTSAVIWRTKQHSTDTSCAPRLKNSQDKTKTERGHCLHYKISLEILWSTPSSLGTEGGCQHNKHMQCHWWKITTLQIFKTLILHSFIHLQKQAINHDAKNKDNIDKETKVQGEARCIKGKKKLNWQLPPPPNLKVILAWQRLKKTSCLWMKCRWRVHEVDSEPPGVGRGRKTESFEAASGEGVECQVQWCCDNCQMQENRKGSRSFELHSGRNKKKSWKNCFDQGRQKEEENARAICAKWREAGGIIWMVCVAIGSNERKFITLAPWCSDSS